MLEVTKSILNTNQYALFFLYLKENKRIADKNEA